MCNRYRLSAKQAELAARYGADLPYLPDEVYPPGELFPDRPAWIVREEDGKRRLDVVRWGWPMTVQGKRPGTMLRRAVTNVRTLASPMWRSALAAPARRCLVPVTSFSEYGPGPKGAKPLWWFKVPSRPIFSFAGIWRPAEGGAVFAFLTTEPNSLVAPIHPKAMPVILDDEGERAWLEAPAADALALVAPFPAQLMAIARNEG